MSVANGATYTAGSSGLNVAGDLTLNSTATFTKGAGTVTLKPSGTKPWTDSTASGQDLGTVAIASGSTTPQVNLGSSVKATSVTIAASHTLDANGSNTLTLTGGSTPFVVSGTFTPSTGTVAYTGASPALGSTTYYNATFNGSGTATLGGDVTATNIFTIQAGTLDAGAGTVTPFVVTGTFTPSTSTVVYTHGTSANVTATTYNTLQTNGAGTYTLGTG